MQLKQTQKIQEITAQIVHDIRSPLFSLQVLMKRLQGVDEETRIALQNIATRINNIANNLIVKYGSPGEGGMDDPAYTKVKKAAAESNAKIILGDFGITIPEYFKEHDKEANFIQPDYILIDDDVNLITAWRIAAELEKINLWAFSSLLDFNLVKNKVDKKVPIYVDYHLDLANGADYSQDLSKEGFVNIYLATNYDKSFFKKPMPWLKGIVGKVPPFLETHQKYDNDFITGVDTDVAVASSIGSSSDLEQLWKKMYHDLMTDPALISSTAKNLEKYLPKLIKNYRKLCATSLNLDEKDQINDATISILEKSVSLLSGANAAQIWRLNVKHILFAVIDKHAFPLQICKMSDCIEKAFAEFPAAGLYAIKNLSPPVIKDFTFLGNLQLMKYVLFNLLDNALYGMRHHGELKAGQLEIYVTQDENANFLHFKNAGEGVAPEILSRFFTKFFTTKTSKVGLGLYFCKNVMDFFGGSIKAISDTQQGFVEFILEFNKV